MTQIHLNTKVGLRTATYCACLSFWQILIQIKYYWTCLKHLNVYFNGRRNSWNPVSTINIIKRNQSDCAVAFFRRPVYIGRGCRKAKQLGLKSFSLDLLFLCVTVSRGFFFLFLFFYWIQINGTKQSVPFILIRTVNYRSVLDFSDLHDPEVGFKGEICLTKLRSCFPSWCFLTRSQRKWQYRMGSIIACSTSLCPNNNYIGFEISRRTLKTSKMFVRYFLTKE